MQTKILLDEAMDKHRELKARMLKLLERCSMPNYTKQKLQDELFKLYKELK